MTAADNDDNDDKHKLSYQIYILGPIWLLSRKQGQPLLISLQTYQYHSFMLSGPGFEPAVEYRLQLC
jgi:hypothetical protein